MRTVRMKNDHVDEDHENENDHVDDDVDDEK